METITREFREMKTDAQSTNPCSPCHMDILTVDNLISIMQFLPGHAVANLLRVCKTWLTALSDPLMWKFICISHFGDTRYINKQMISLGGWKEVFIRTPLVRFDGGYILKHTTYRKGGMSIRMEAEELSRVIEMSYYRYVRFYPNNLVEYAVVNTNPAEKPIPKNKLTRGNYRWMKDGRVQFKAAMSHLTVYIQCDLTETWDGAHNRLYFSQFKGECVSCDGVEYMQHFAMDDCPWRFWPDFDDYYKDWIVKKPKTFEA